MTRFLAKVGPSTLAILLAVLVFNRMYPAPRKPDLSVQAAGGIEGLDVSRDGRWFVVLTNHGRLSVHDARTGRERWAVKARAEMAAFVDRDSHIFLLFDRPQARKTVTTVTYLDAATGRQVRRIEAPGVTAGYCPGPSHVITLDFSDAARSGLKVCSLADGRMAGLVPHTGPVMSASMSPGGQYLAAGDMDGKKGLILWDLLAGKPVDALNGRVPRCHFASLSGDGRYLATAALDGRLDTWRVGSWKHAASVYSGLSHAEIAWLGSGSDRMIVEGAEAAVRRGPLDTGYRHVVDVRDVRTGAHLQRWRDEDLLDVSGDGRAAVTRPSGSDPWLVRDVRTGWIRARIDVPGLDKDLDGGPSSDERARLSSDGSVLVAGDRERGLVRVWRLRP